jgi:mRNA-degrading endonuclease YafQ of YafQ-DinJ toxin-antitoxin module
MSSRWSQRLNGRNTLLSRPLLRSSAFIRSARKMLKKHPALTMELQAALELRSQNAFHPSLKTHKLKGELQGSWACSVGFDLRIIFAFVEAQGVESILLESMGSHEEVY